MSLASVLALLLLLSQAEGNCHGDVNNSGNLKVAFGDYEVHFNQMVELSKVQDAPTLKITSDPMPQGSKVMVVMVDPDAPGMSACTYWLHWFILGTFSSNTVTSPTTITTYFPPSPPANSGIHRYQVLVYQVPSNTSQSPISTRGGFDLSATVQSLQAGQPKASFQFKAQHS